MKELFEQEKCDNATRNDWRIDDDKPHTTDDALSGGRLYRGGVAMKTVIYEHSLDERRSYCVGLILAPDYV